jgi:uncharacterized protein DUF6042
MTRWPVELRMSGWLEVLPEPGRWFLDIAGETGEDGHPQGIDERSLIQDGELPQAGFAAVYDPTTDSSLKPWEIEVLMLSWTPWQQLAAEHDHAMSTYADIVSFMTELGLLKRVEDGDDVRWYPPEHLPLAEDILNLTQEHLDRRTTGRRLDEIWLLQLKLLYWLNSKRSDDPVLRVKVSIASLAAELDLDTTVARRTLGYAARDLPEVELSQDPTRAGLNDPLAILVDLQRLDERYPEGLDP